ncbi:MAG: DUF2125 domain-containing protein [Rhodobacteraceae bacterium]|nr:DUF2125 domain-containing protein [Paracoccaceae bacterium]
MRRLLGGVVVLTLVWSGYWALAARTLDQGLAAWFAARRAEGWVAEYDTLAVAGFPTRFETTLTGLALADPDTGLAWAAPVFRFAAPSYQPQHVTATWPPAQQIATPRETITLDSTTMQGALAFRPGPALELVQARYALAGVALISDAGWRAEMAQADLASDAVADRPNAHHIVFSATQMRPPARLVAMLDKAQILPDLFERIGIDATLDFDAPWDRHAVEDRRPQITRIELALLDATWGRLALQAAGDLSVDGNGRPSGEIAIRATNWREMVAIARASGRMSPRVADRIEGALGVVAGLSGRADTLDVTLRLAGGQTWLGPVPLGPAPDFTIR